ncbi:MAG: DNA repair protein RecO [bacterium]
MSRSKTMSIYKTRAIVLRTRELGETSRIIRLYSLRYGKIDAVAKGIRNLTSRFGARLEPFTLVDLVLWGDVEKEGLQIITQAQIINSHQALREDLDRIAISSFLVELVESLVEGGSEANIFYLLENFLYALETRISPLFIYAFLLKLLSLLGLKPHLKDCLNCHGQVETRVVFSAAEGGIFCLSCAPPRGVITISAGTLALAKQLLALPPLKIDQIRPSPPLLLELKSMILDHLLAQHLPRHLKSLKFLIIP